MFKDKTHAEIAELINRSPLAVQNRCSKLRLIKVRQITKKDLLTIADRRDSTTQEDLASELEMSVTSLREAMSRYGLRSKRKPGITDDSHATYLHRRGYSDRQMARILGFSECAVRTWRTKQGLSANGFGNHSRRRLQAAMRSDGAQRVAKRRAARAALAAEMGAPMAETVTQAKVCIALRVKPMMRKDLVEEIYRLRVPDINRCQLLVKPLRRMIAQGLVSIEWRGKSRPYYVIPVGTVAAKSASDLIMDAANAAVESYDDAADREDFLPIAWEAASDAFASNVRDNAQLVEAAAAAVRRYRSSLVTRASVDRMKDDSGFEGDDSQQRRRVRLRREWQD